MKKFTFVIILLFSIVLVGCGVKNTSNENSKNVVKKDDLYSVTLFYPSKNYIITGNENPKYITVNAEIKSNLENLPENILKELIEKPIPEDGVQAITKDLVEISKVELKDNTAIVDFSYIGSGGSLDEEILIGEIVKSLTSVDEIKKVKFTKNGDNLQSILGHFDTESDLNQNFDEEY